MWFTTVSRALLLCAALLFVESDCPAPIFAASSAKPKKPKKPKLPKPRVPKPKME